jgi:dTDP-4-dehydrorhamnose reductase
LFESDNVIDGFDATDFSLLEGVLKGVRPHVVLNCIGITKRHVDDSNVIPCITLNSLLPHYLANWGATNGVRIIHFSTDCVFDGKIGNYLESSFLSANDLYGKTKAMGEISSQNVLTLRSSFIGPELRDGTELLEWVRAQTGTVKGFRGAIYSGFTTMELSRIVERMLIDHPDAVGLYNVSSDPISKYDLLTLIKEKIHLDIEIIPDETFHCDRSLNSARFRQEFTYIPPTWETMIEELSKDLKEETHDI